MSVRNNEIENIRTIIKLVNIKNIPREQLEGYVVTLLEYIDSSGNQPNQPPTPSLPPSTSFKDKPSKNLKNCNICLSEIKEGECKTTRCMHIFHTHCLNRWIAQCKKDYKVAKCPTCRFELESTESDIKLITQKEEYSDVIHYTRGEVIWRTDHTNTLNRLDSYHPGTKNLTCCAHCKDHYRSHQKVIIYKDSKHAYSIHKTCERKVENGFLKRLYKAYVDKKIKNTPFLFSSFRNQSYLCNVTLAPIQPSITPPISPPRTLAEQWSSLFALYTTIDP